MDAIAIEVFTVFGEYRGEEMAFLASTKAWGKQKKEGEETDSLVA